MKKLILKKNQKVINKVSETAKSGNCGAVLPDPAVKRKSRLPLIIVSALIVVTVALGGYFVVNSVVLPNSAKSAMAQALKENDRVSAETIYEKYCVADGFAYDELSPSGKAVYEELSAFFKNTCQTINEQPQETDINTFINNTYGDLFVREEGYLTVFILNSSQGELCENIQTLYLLLDSKQAFQTGLQYFQNKKWLSAIEAFSEVIEEDSWYQDAQTNIEEADKKIAEEQLNQVDAYVASGDIDEARAYIASLGDELSGEAQERLEQALKAKANEYLEKADAALKSGERIGAYDMAVAAQTLCPDDAEMAETMTYYQSFLPYELYVEDNAISYKDTMWGYDGGLYWNETLTSNNNQAMAHNLDFYYQEVKSSFKITYNLGKKYDTVSGVTFVREKYKNLNQEGYLKIYGDGKLLYTSPKMDKNVMPQNIKVSISGVDVLTLVFEGSPTGEKDGLTTSGYTWRGFAVSELIATKNIPE